MYDAPDWALGSMHVPFLRRLTNSAGPHRHSIPKDRAPGNRKTTEELRAVQNAGQQACHAEEQDAAGHRAAQELLDLQVIVDLL